MSPQAPGQRSGFVALAGRPNVGKSTLANQIVGAKVAIVSDRPQTTRRAIRGVATGPDWQLVLVDLPGVQKPLDPLTTRMQKRVDRELVEADAVLFVVNGEQGIGGPGDKFIAEQLRESSIPVILAVNKCDRLERPKTVVALSAAADLGVGEEIYPVSARTGKGVGPLVEDLIARLPPGPFMYPPDEISDLGEKTRLAELVREQILNRTFQEVPHAVEVDLTEFEERESGVVYMRAAVWVETPSQKGIVIGAGGRMVKAIGVAARRSLERDLGTKVHLDLEVRVRRRWRADDGLLDRLGIE